MSEHQGIYERTARREVCRTCLKPLPPRALRLRSKDGTAVCSKCHRSDARR